MEGEEIETSEVEISNFLGCLSPSPGFLLEVTSLYINLAHFDSKQ
jgi:hypothetical protein